MALVGIGHITVGSALSRLGVAAAGGVSLVRWQSAGGLMTAGRTAVGAASATGRWAAVVIGAAGYAIGDGF